MKMLVLSKIREPKNNVEKQIDEIQLAIVDEIEKAIKAMDFDIGYSKYILKNLASDLQRDARL